MREKLKNVEILRFIFIVQIMLMHLTCSAGLLKSLPVQVPLYLYLRKSTCNAYVGVDFFYIIAGFFLCYTFKNTSCYEFTIKKYKRFLPTMSIALAIIFLLSCCYDDIVFDWYKFFYTMTFTGSFTPYGGGYSWFIAPLFWASLFYFYLLKNFDKKYLNLVFPILTICSYSLLINTSGNNFWNVRPQLFQFLNVGILRALAGMGIGYFAALLYREKLHKLRDINLAFPYRILITFIEIGLLFFIIYFGSIHVFKPNAMMFILVFSALFIAFLTKQGYVSRLMDNKLSVFLGKYVFTIYILEEAMHSYLRHLISEDPQLIIKYGGGVLFLVIIGHIGLCIVIYHCVRKLGELYEKYRTDYS